MAQLGATLADRATVALTALDDFDRDPTNEIQTLTFDTITNILRLSKPSGQPDEINLSKIPLRAPGASIDYPFGIYGDGLLITTNYTVPAGKTLFISAVNNPIDLADNRILNLEPGMPILPAGTAIRSCFCSGLLVTTQNYAIPLILDFSTSTFEYTVPMGFSLILKSGTNNSRDMSFIIDCL